MKTPTIITIAILLLTTQAHAFFGWGETYNECRVAAAQMPTKEGVRVALQVCREEHADELAEARRVAADQKETLRLAIEAQCIEKRNAASKVYENMITREKASRRAESPEQKVARHQNKQYWSDEYPIAERNHKSEIEEHITYVYTNWGSNCTGVAECRYRAGAYLLPKLEKRYRYFPHIYSIIDAGPEYVSCD